jgi:hypothetical protein
VALADDFARVLREAGEDPSAAPGRGERATGEMRDAWSILYAEQLARWHRHQAELARAVAEYLRARREAGQDEDPPRGPEWMPPRRFGVW